MRYSLSDIATIFITTFMATFMAITGWQPTIENVTVQNMVQTVTQTVTEGIWTCPPGYVASLDHLRCVFDAGDPHNNHLNRSVR